MLPRGLFGDAAGNKKRANMGQLVLNVFKSGANVLYQVEDKNSKYLALATACMRLLTPSLL